VTHCQEPVADSLVLMTLAYGPSMLAARMGSEGLTCDMIDANQGPSLDRLPALPILQFKDGLEVCKGSKNELS